MSEQLLKINNLSIDYKVKDGYLSAVNKINLTINKGEIFALVGESGCGKSTIAHSLLQLLPAKNTVISGEAIFKDENLVNMSAKKIEHVRGKEISMIFQNPLDSLNPVFKVGNQVQEAILLDKVNKIDAWNKVIDLFKQVKMPDAEERANSFPHELSGGMRQRVMIAMMLSRNPELLIADEPTTALDVTIEAQILEILKQLRDNYDTAIMLITHNFGLVAEIADKIGVMYAGEMIEMGDVYEIFKNPIHPYTKLLMQALPRITKNHGRLTTIEGSVPRITEKKEECRFANRCPYATDKCRNQEPPLVVLENGHSYRCFKAREV
ncbi:MAG: ABC transporter ATP-binding protein [[Eubacterium] sulci]|jgi:oligopeptide/dipeptide ABC transporter, ATP-binding protein, C-terminal domain|nr:ABC transporter ATP-binding protein [[Eubacterium] sulci]MBF1171779.1 ABC transporter ATP-binding protein [[Eubacterium] sulci]